MNHFNVYGRRSLIALSFLTLAGVAAAQPGPMGGRCGPGTAASAAAGDCPGHQAGMHHRMRGGPDNTSGWPMMNAAERQAHHDKLAGMKSREECKTYMDAHHAQMQERAKAAGRKAPAMPRGDACAALK
jgi:hypothetical protein